MNNKKKIILIIAISVIAILIILLILLNFIIKAKKVVINKIDINNDKVVNLCLDSNVCELEGTYSYPIINIDTNSLKIKRIIKNYNKETNNLYNKVINSNLNSNECHNIKDKYKYRYLARIYNDIYHDDKVVSIAREVHVKDLCTDKDIENDLIVKVYDMNTNRLLSNEEILKLYNLTEDDIITKINEGININNDISTDKLTIKDIYKDGKLNYNIYFDEENNMIINYMSSKTKRRYDIVMKKVGG